MQTSNQIIALFFTTVVVLTATACRNGTSTQSSDAAQTLDREGNPVTLPQKIDRIISLGPSNTEILAALGVADKIVATDTYSRGIDGLADDIPLFNMMAPDGEQILLLEPDVIFVAGMCKTGGIDPFQVLSDVGICVLFIPTTSSIAGIQEDIRFIAKVMDAVEKGDAIVADMDETIDAIARTAETIPNRKTVYFEISAESYSLYSFGRDVFLHEMLEMIGAENILADRNQWIAVSDEVILKRNPDVILTNVDAIDEPVKEIMSRPGWDVITAVRNGDVYFIDAAASSRPTHNVMKSLQQMAKAVYPDKY